MDADQALALMNAAPKPLEGPSFTEGPTDPEQEWARYDGVIWALAKAMALLMRDGWTATQEDAALECELACRERWPGLDKWLGGTSGAQNAHAYYWARIVGPEVTP